MQERTIAIPSLALGLALCASFAATAQPFGASGAEFRVNTVTTGAQYGPSAAVDSAGAFFVAWESHDRSFGVEKGIKAQRYSSAGAPLGGEFLVNTYSGFQYEPAAASGAPGEFMVVWRSGDQDGPLSLFARRFAGGAPSTGEFRVNTATTGFNRYPVIAASKSSGGYVVAWAHAATQGGNQPQMTAKRFAAGVPQAPEILVPNDTALSNGPQPEVAAAPNGDFIVGWGESGFARAQRYAASGAAAGGVFTASTPTAGSAAKISIAYDGSGGFVVAWPGGPLNAQRYASTGAPLGGTFQVNTDEEGTNLGPPQNVRVASDQAGNFVVGWNDSYYRVWMRRYSSTGAPLADQLRLNASTAEEHFGSLAMGAGGDFLVTWARNPAFDGGEVFARRFCASLAGDANGSGAIDVADVFYLINFIFAGGPVPLAGSDANGDGATNVADVFYLINFLFAGGPGPACRAPLG